MKGEKRVVTRRNFLTTVGLLTGAALPGMQAFGLMKEIAPLSNMPTTGLEAAKALKVIILGGGLAGMSSAYELTKLGYDCTILEARNRSGGRAFSIRKGATTEEITNGKQTANFDDGLYFNAGPSRIPHFHKTTLHYCKEFGVALEVYNNVDEATYYFSEGKGNLSNKKIKKGALHNDMRGYTAELLAKSIDSKALDLPLTKEDGEKFLEFLRAEGALDIDDLYKGSSRRGYTDVPGAGAKAGTLSEPYKLAEIVNSGLLGTDFYGVAEYVYELQQTMLQMVGGNDKLAQAFEKRVGNLMKMNAEVTDILNEAEKVTVTYKDATGTHKLEADYCICTIPLPVLSNINHNFSSNISRAIDKTSYISTGKLAMQFKRRFWEEDDEIYGGITHTNNEIFQIFYPSNDYLSKNGLLIVYYNFNDRANAIGELSYAAREKLAFEKGRLVHPQYDQDYDHKSFSVSWHKTKYSLGGWGIYSEQERETLYKPLLAGDKRTSFAGEHLSYLNGWMAGALESARNVVTALHERVTKN
jgi:monoamine oxidase